MTSGSVASWLALVGLVAWNLLRPDFMFGLPFWLTWLAVVAAFLAGLGAGRVFSGRRKTVLFTAMGLAAALAAGWFAVAHLGLDAPGQPTLRGAVVVGIGAFAGLATRGWWRRPLSAQLLLVAAALAAWGLSDAAIVGEGVGLYDFRVYLEGARHFFLGQTAYLDHVLAVQPSSPGADYFLYPPPVLPVFAFLASLPRRVADAIWLTGLAASALAAFRLLGLRWRWAFLLLAFPPLVKGMESGNVANLLLLMLAAGPVAGAGLLLGLLFKVQSVIPGVWLVRERRWRDLAIGTGIVLAVSVVTLPLVGIDSWGRYLAGLELRERSQVVLPILYGDSLMRFLPVALFLAISVLAVVVALLPRGRRSLAALGVASAVASPTLWPHGFLAALPAVLALPTSLLWLALGIAPTSDGLWVFLVLGVIALVRDWGHLAIPPDSFHPLSGTSGPWPGSRPGAGGAAARFPAQPPGGGKA
jgi:hypothetical protein